MANINVLIVEDEPLILIDIIDFLEDEKFHVFEATTASAALDMLYCDVQAHCLVADVDLGNGMDGLDLAVAVRKKWPEMGIIIVSGKSQIMPPSLTEAIFFPKPYEPSTIADMIRELVGAHLKKQARRAGRS